MTEQAQEKSIMRQRGSVPTVIPCSHDISIDISWLPEEERRVLLVDYTKGMLDISKKARELKIDADALKTTLDNLSDTTQEVARSGNAVTITHSQTTKTGRTEVIMGNTGQALSGKLTKSQTGEKDWTPYYIFAGILALIIIAALMR
ncbi:MAG: hypothetical protein N3B18_05325 [Desulfobacterota bacterium]|nr:hypothetical protein [Thermodesulfobacteriota bacterium]